MLPIFTVYVQITIGTPFVCWRTPSLKFSGSTQGGWSHDPIPPSIGLRPMENSIGQGVNHLWVDMNFQKIL